MAKTKFTAIRLDKVTYDAIENLAYFEMKSMSEVARELIELGLSHLLEKELKYGREM